MTLAFIKAEELKIHSDAGDRPYEDPYEDGGRDCRDAATSQGMPKITDAARKRERGLERVLPPSLRKEAILSTLFVLLASKTGTEPVSVDFSH